MAQWPSGSISRFHTTGSRFYPRAGQIDSAFHPPCSRLTNGYQACLRTLTLGVSLQIDHLIGTSAHAPQHPMVTYTVMGTVGQSLHGLLRH
ncbi:hypothetical protein TNCV_1523641 [Trichonephila clavipes]|nr:hypothetical protein TNCV_1523641 [Trichonephila clavipes]